MPTTRIFWGTTIRMVSGILLLFLSISDYLNEMSEEQNRYVKVIFILFLICAFSITWIKAQMVKSLFAQNTMKFLFALVVIFVVVMSFGTLFNLINREISKLIGLLAISAYYITSSLIKFLATKDADKITNANKDSL